MKAYTTSENVRKALDIANEQYSGNLQFKTFTPKSNHVNFTLRVADSSGPGARRGFSGRRMVSACWHAHRDFMKALFDLDAGCRLTSAQADYRGRENFEDTFAQTGDKNIGSMMRPMAYCDACDCF